MIDPALFARLEARARAAAAGRAPAPAPGHVLRVVENARRLAEAEGGDAGVLLAAAVLHELVNLPKGHPDSSRSGDLCAIEAERVLREEGFPAAGVAAVVACIRDHAFSKGVVPEALEARLLQDADRLDAIGAIGVARCFATTADMKRPFYDPADPFCRRRAPDDKAYGLDHFFKKLLLLEARFHTETARRLAAKRTAFLRTFLSQREEELGAPPM